MAHTVVALLDGSPLDECVLQQASELTGPSGQLVSIQTVREGRGARAKAFAAAQSADFLVLGLPAQHGFDGVTAGSTVQHVVEWSPVPVLLARDRRGELRHLHERPRILVALDGSEFAEAALRVAAELATTTASALSFVQVVPLAGSLQPPGAAAWDVCPLDAMVAAARKYLRDCAERFARAYDLETPRLHVEVGQAWQAVSDVIGEDSIQLLVMATHAHARWRRLLLGSVTDHVLRETSIPVVLVHPHTPPEALHSTPRTESRAPGLVGSGAR